MRTFQRFLIVRSNGDTRVVTRRPVLDPDEVAVPINVVMPDGWGKISPDPITINMPEPPSVSTTGEPIRGEVDGAAGGDSDDGSG